MGVAIETIAPAKFISCISHVVMMITLFWTYEQNLKTGLPSGYSNDEELSAKASVFACVVLSLCMEIFEIFVLFMGYSLFFDNVNLVQIIFHLFGTVITSWYILDDWDYNGIWAIWFFTIFFPFILEVATISRTKAYYNS